MPIPAITFQQETGSDSDSSDSSDCEDLEKIPASCFYYWEVTKKTLDQIGLPQIDFETTSSN